MIKVLLVKNKWLNTPGNHNILCPTEMVLTDTISTLENVETHTFYYDEQCFYLGTAVAFSNLEILITAYGYDIVIFRLHPYPTPQWITMDNIRQLKRMIQVPFVVWWGDSDIGCDHNYMQQINSCMNLSIYYDSPFYMHDAANCKFIPGLYNTNVFKDIGIERTIDVSIAGENTRECRKKVIDSLRLNGIDVISIGGWIDGWVSDEDYIKIYQKSKISLGIVGTDKKLRAKIYEIPLCGAMLLADDTTIVKMLYTPNKECVVFSDEFEALEACEYYLEHDAERLKITEAGHKKALKLCNIENYWNRVFSEVGVIND